jgi:hypothetical protein
MKISAVSVLLFLVLALPQAPAQQNRLVPDQNPRFKESERRYFKGADSLTNTLGMTVQQTYRAYDWYEARLERREQRRQWRKLHNLNYRYYDNLWYPRYYKGYSCRYSRFNTYRDCY